MNESRAATSAEPRAVVRARGGSPDAARTTWTPFTSAIARRTRPAWIEASRRAAVAGAVALLLGWLDRTAMAGLVALVALSLVALAALAPAAYRAIDRFFLRASSVVGRALSYLLLGPVFFLVVTPLRVLLRSGTRARWGSGRDPATRSHWKPRDRSAPRLDRPY